MEQSEKLGRADFVDGILDACTWDNTLVGIPGKFMIRTVLGNGSQLENKAGLTLEKLYSAADRYPEAKAFDEMTKESLMQYLMMFNEDTFIDWDTGACRFDSEEFKAVLAYLNQFPDSVKKSLQTTEVESLSARLQNGEVLFAVAELYPPLILQDYEKIFGDDAACVENN